MIKRINKNIILKLRAKYLKGGVDEKMDLAKEAGSRGFSNLQMDKKLKEMGYGFKRRKTVIENIVGGKKILPEDYKLSMKELKDKYNLSAEEAMVIEKRKAVRKRMNIALGRESSGEVKEYIGDRGGIKGILRGKKKIKQVYGLKKGASSEEDLGVGKLSKVVGHFAGSKSVVASNKHVGLVGPQGGSVTNQLNNTGNNSAGPAMPLAKS